LSFGKNDDSLVLFGHLILSKILTVYSKSRDAFSSVYVAGEITDVKTGLSFWICHLWN